MYEETKSKETKKKNKMPRKIKKENKVDSNDNAAKTCTRRRDKRKRKEED